jgi:hypothetical protein
MFNGTESGVGRNPKKSDSPERVDRGEWESLGSLQPQEGVQMSRRLAVAVLSAAMMLVLFPTGSSAHTSTDTTGHVLLGKSQGPFQATVFGRLGSNQPDCSSGETVILRRGNGQIIGSDVTDGNGDYAFNFSRRLAGPPGPPGRDRMFVHAEYTGRTDNPSYQHSHTCLSSNSGVLTIPDPPCHRFGRFRFNRCRRFV